MAIPKEKVLESEKQTGDDQVLDGGKQTDLQPDEGDKEIDLTKELNTRFVLNPKRPDMTLTGEQLRNAAGLGKLASERESELHKTQEKLKQVEQEKAESDRQLEMLRINSKIFDLESRSSKETTEDVFEFEAETEPEIDQKKVIRQQIDPILKKTESEIAELKATIQSFAQAQTERDRKEAFQRFGQATQKARQDSLRKQLSVLTQKEIDEIVANENSARIRDLQADELSKQGKDDEAMDLVIEADSYRETAVELRAQGLLKQQRAKAKEEAKEALLQQTRSSVDEIKVTEDLSKAELNPDKAKEKSAKLMEITRRKAEARRLFNLNQE